MNHCTRAQLGLGPTRGYGGFVRGESLGPVVSESRGRALRRDRFCLPVAIWEGTLGGSQGPTTNGSDRTMRRVVCAPCERERQT